MRSRLQALRTAEPSLKALRDMTATQLSNEGWRLSGVQLRRARHVITENQRVLQAAAALQRGDARKFGQLLNQSHLSLRDDYEVSCSELDALVDICTSTPGVLGARLTGAGFGGCVIAIAAADRADRAVTAIAERYRMTTGLPGTGYTVRPARELTSGGRPQASRDPEGFLARPKLSRREQTKAYALCRAGLLRIRIVPERITASGGSAVSRTDSDRCFDSPSGAVSVDTDGGEEVLVGPAGVAGLGGQTQYWTAPMPRPGTRAYFKLKSPSKTSALAAFASSRGADPRDDQLSASA